MSDAEEIPARKMTLAERHKLKHAQLAAATAEKPAQPAQPVAKVAKPAVATPASDITPDHRRQSPVQRHKARMMVAAAIASAGATDVAAPRPTTGPEATAYELLRAQLGEHLRQLQDISSVERKIEAKRQMVDVYDDHVLAVLDSDKETDKAVQDEVFVTVMVWRLDIGDWDMALEMAAYVLKHGLELPERYKRNAATLIAEEIATPALKVTQLEKPFSIEVLQRAIELTDDKAFNVNDIVRAKLQKALGLQFNLLASTIEEGPDAPAGGKRAAQANALAHLNRAFELHEACGVKKERERLTKLLEKSPAEPETATE